MCLSNFDNESALVFHFHDNVANCLSYVLVNGSMVDDLEHDHLIYGAFIGGIWEIVFAGFLAWINEIGGVVDCLLDLFLIVHFGCVSVTHLLVGFPDVTGDY